jgi:hypothetical protein
MQLIARSPYSLCTAVAPRVAIKTAANFLCLRLHPIALLHYRRRRTADLRQASWLNDIVVRWNQ